MTEQLAVTAVDCWVLLLLLCYYYVCVLCLCSVVQCISIIILTYVVSICIVTWLSPGCIVPLFLCSLIVLLKRITVTSAVHERCMTDCSQSVRACRTLHNVAGQILRNLENLKGCEMLSI